jgi:hypothetical protein
LIGINLGLGRSGLVVLREDDFLHDGVHGFVVGGHGREVVVEVWPQRSEEEVIRVRIAIA